MLSFGSIKTDSHLDDKACKWGFVVFVNYHTGAALVGNVKVSGDECAEGRCLVLMLLVAIVLCGSQVRGDFTTGEQDWEN